MKIFINTTNWAIQKIENEYPVLVGDNYVDAIKVYYDQNPSTAHIYPTLTIQKPNGRKIGPFVYDPEVYGEDENETTTYPITYVDADSNTWYMYAFTLSSDNGQLTSTGKYQVTITTNKTNALGTAIVGQRNTNVQLEVLHAVINDNQDILILGDSPDEVVASFQQLITNLTSNVAALGNSKADRNNNTQEIVAKTIKVEELNSVDAYTVLKLAMQTGYSIIIDDNMITLKDNSNVSIAEFRRTASEEVMKLGSDFDLKAKASESQVLSNEIPLRLIFSGANDNTEIKLSDGKIELLAPNNIKVTVDDAGYINLTTPKAELEVSNPDNRVLMHIEDTDNGAIYGDMILDTDGLQVLTTDGDNIKQVIVTPNSATIDNEEIVTEDVLDTETSNLQSQIDGINAGQNLADIVADLTALNNLSIANLNNGDKVQVLVDSNHDNASTVYSLTISGSSHSWSYIGKYGQDGYTKAEANALLDLKADKSTTYTKTETDTLLNAKADLTNNTQVITADKVKVNEIRDISGSGNVKTTYSSSIIMDRVENPNDSDNYAYSYLSTDLIEMYCRKDGYRHSRMDVRNTEASFYVSTLEDATQYMPKRASTSFFGILNYPYMAYTYAENDVNLVNSYFYLNYDGFRVNVNSNELKVDRTTNKLTYNSNEIIDTNNATTELFLTDAEMATLISEVFN